MDYDKFLILFDSKFKLNRIKVLVRDWNPLHVTVSLRFYHNELHNFNNTGA